MALTDTEDFFRLSVIAMPKRRSIFDFREQRAKQPCLHGYLATAARIKYSLLATEYLIDSRCNSRYDNRRRCFSHENSDHLFCACWRRDNQSVL